MAGTSKIDKRADNALLSSYGPEWASIGVDSDTGELKYNPDGTIRTVLTSGGGGGGSGGVTGPASATDNAITRFDGTTGGVIQNSPVTISDGGVISGVAAPSAGTDAANKTYVDNAVATNAAADAPVDASYVTLGTHSGLSDERVLTAGPGITLTDAGAGSTLTVGVTGLDPGEEPAPNTASYVTLGTNADLDNERVLTAGTGITVTDGGAGSTVTIAASAAQQALANPAYVTISNTTDLANERALTGTANQITVTDNGAGSSVVLSTPQNIHTAATPQFARVGLGQAADASTAVRSTGQIVSDEHNAGNSSTALTIDFANGNCQRFVLTGNCTLTLSNPREGGRYLLLISQDGTGSRTITWPAAVKWPGGVAPTLTTTASALDIVTLVYTDSGAGNIYVAAANMDFR